MTAMTRRFVMLALPLVTLAILEAEPVRAQDYPNRPVRIICESAPGSSIDASLRIIADRLGQLWGRQVLIVNHPGAGGAIAARVAASSPNDGYTLYAPASSAFVGLPGTTAGLPIEVPRDFAPIGLVTQLPLFMGAVPSLGATTLAELIAVAKQRPGELSYAVTGVGRLTHLTGELLQSRTGIKLLMVPYAGGAPQALNDIMSGRVPIIIESYSGLSPAFQSGSLNPIAVGTAERLSNFPDLATFSETISGMTAMGWVAMAAPNGTPEAIVSKVSGDLRKAVEVQEIKDKLAATGSYVRAMSPSEVVAFTQSEQKLWRPVLQQIAAMPR